MSSSNDPRPTVSLPALPVGGGAVRGIGEKFSTSASMGTMSISVPLAMSPGRAGADLSLSLTWDSGAGNGPFGVGWGLGVPEIRRKTDRGVPRYDDTDVFLSGSEDLVPVGAPTPRGAFEVQRFRPRIETTFVRLERWRANDGDVHWRAWSADDVLSVFGRTRAARISDPADDSKVFSWLLEETRDSRGHVVHHLYQLEDHAGVDVKRPSEVSRGADAQRYLKRVRYGNVAPLMNREAPLPTAPEAWCFELVFDYGEHDLLAPRPDDAGEWSVRQDRFSTYRAGFEVRTRRLCRRALMFHRFTELGAAAQLVRATEFTYDASAVLSRLSSVVHAGFVSRGAGYERLALPAVEYGYEAVAFHDTVESRPMARLGEGGQWVDLEGRALPGLLFAREGEWSYCANAGDGVLRAATLEHVSPRPGTVGARGVLTDVDGSGTVDFVSLSSPATVTSRTSGGWSPLAVLPSVPNLSWDDPRVRWLDADGDGIADVVVSEVDAVVFYRSKGKDGFEAPVRVPLTDGAQAGPAMISGTQHESLLLADMTGDGLTDLVRVRNRAVTYWPNLGNGHFGAAVTLEQRGGFDDARFDASRVRLADLDGSGPCDVVYLGAQGAQLYVNESGNALSAKGVITSLGTITRPDHFSVIDFLGKGTACLVHHEPARRGAQLRWVDLLGGVKPHLLTSIRNNLGAETKLQWAPSTRFELEDRARGQPWLTRLAFPVHVLERLERRDTVSGATQVSRWAYHHGVFDGREREFRGFACVEQWDADTVDHATQPLGVPPVRTVSWFHPGTDEGHERTLARDYAPTDPLASTLRLPPAQLDATTSARDRREALRALRGVELRRETWLEGAASPQLVVEHTHFVRVIQSATERAHGVYFPWPAQSLRLHYERATDDPRIEHQLMLKVDDFGTVELSATVVYPRREARCAADEAASGLSLDEQRELKCLVERTRHAHRATELDWYRVNQPVERSVSELTGLTAPLQGLLSATVVQSAIDTFPTLLFHQPASWNVAGQRTVHREQVLYSRAFADVAAWRADAGGPLPLGDFERQGLEHHTRTWALTSKLVNQVFGARATAPQGSDGYETHEGDWWAPTGRRVHDPSAFFLVVETIDPFGAVELSRHDRYALMVLEREDALHNVTRSQPDYRTLAPHLVTDANGGQRRVETDALGRVTRCWTHGRVAADGSVEGDELAHPGIEFRYQLETVPAFTAVATRERHNAGGAAFAVDGTPTRTGFQHARVWSDGSGREVMKKVQAQPGPGAGLWLGTGRTVFDNKGNPVKRYEPFFTDSFEWETDLVLVQRGVSRLYRYDPLNRVVRIDNPDGTFSRVVYDGWRRETWDEGDTVLESRWFADRGAPLPSQPEPAGDDARAAWLMARHAKTPNVSFFDALGRVVASRSADALTRLKLDLEGHPLQVTDARGLLAATQHFDALGRRLGVDGADTGSSRSFPDAAGVATRTWDAVGRMTRSTLDPLRRPSQTFVTLGAGAERLVLQHVYGEAHATPEPLHLRTRVWKVLDEAGQLTHDRWDFHGNASTVSREAFADGTLDIDWAQPPALSAEKLLTTCEFDALSRIVERRGPDGASVRYGFGEGGALSTLTVAGTPFITSVVYDEHGRRKSVERGNGVRSESTYDPDTFRLVRQLTTRAGTTLQDLRYTWDAVGNVVAVRDVAPFGNAAVSADALYEYDESARLLVATGREHPGQQPGPFDPDPIGLPPVAHPADWTALTRYRETFSYDAVGNLTGVKHDTAASTWSRSMPVAADGNRLVGPGISFDANGCLTSLPHVDTLEWDGFSRLRLARGPGQELRCVYGATGERVRTVSTRGAVVEERLTVGTWDRFRRTRGGVLELERTTLQVLDEGRRVALIETTREGATTRVRTRYQLEDHLGSSVMELDEQAAVIGFETFHPYGTSAFSALAVEVSARRFRYSGKERDPQTGFDFFGARFYAPWLGRWISPDPDGLTLATDNAGGGNRALATSLYAYVEGRVVSATDPDGRALNVLAGAGIGFVIGFGGSLIAQAVSGKEIDTSKALAAGVGGAISGALTGLTMGGNLIGQGVMAVAGNVMGGAVTRHMNGEKQTVKAAVVDGGIGLLTFGLVKGGGAVWKQSSHAKMSTAVKELEKETAEAAAKSATNATGESAAAAKSAAPEPPVSPAPAAPPPVEVPPTVAPPPTTQAVTAVADATPQTLAKATPNATPRPKLNVVMGGTASDEAGQSGMVWFHKIGRALGGSDRPENLVAATEEANNLVLVLERMALRLMKRGDTVSMEAAASTFPGTRIGHTLQLKISISNKDLPVTEVFDGIIDLTTREAVPTKAANMFNQSFKLKL